MSMPEVALPGGLLVITYLLRLLVDHPASLLDFIEATIELPLDISFLATSFVVAFTISTPQRVNDGILMFVIYISVCIVVVFLWRRSRNSFEDKKLRITFALVVLNYSICFTVLVLAVQKIIER